MDMDAIHVYCLSFPHATENLQWEDELCFKVGGKIFAMVGLGSVPQRLTLKCRPEHFAELTEREGINPARYVGRYKWITVSRPDALTDSELREAISSSYEMVAAKAKGAKGSGRKRKTRAA